MTQTATGDSWTPEFPGQRPPFQAGHGKSTVHGAFSERRIRPRAAQVKQNLLTGPSCPRYLLSDPSFAPAIDAWSVAQARVEILLDWIDEQDFPAALADHEAHEETEQSTKGKVTRRGTSSRVQSAYAELHKAQTLAAALARGLGLEPASRARIERDLSQSRFYVGATRLDDALEEMERRRALTAGGSDE